MSKVIEDGLAHFRAKLNRHLKIVNDCYAEIARLEALRPGSNPTTGAVDDATRRDFEREHLHPYGYKRECEFVTRIATNPSPLEG